MRRMRRERTRGSFRAGDEKICFWVYVFKIAVGSSNGDDMTNELKKQRLLTLENQIRGGLEQFVQVGVALKEIRDNWLYKEAGFETWDIDRTATARETRTRETFDNTYAVKRFRFQRMQLK
jgi:hypothetical protein